MRDEQRKRVASGLDMLLDSDGLYLVLQPGSHATIEDVLKFISDEQISGVSVDSIRAALKDQSAGRIKLANRHQLTCLNAAAEIRVRSDKLSAELVLRQAGFGGKLIDRDQLDLLLQQAHVVFGIDQELLGRVASGEITQGTYVVARGRPAEKGSPADLIYHVAERSEQADDMPVDHRELGMIQNVNVGDLLVTKIPPGASVPGMTVTGEPIAALPGRDCPLPVGKGVVPSTDGLRLYAALSGHVVFGPRRVDVMSSLEIPGDVDFSSGNIDVNGNAIIHGNVHSGFKVIAQGHVEIDGWVDNAQIKAGGNIVIKGGVKGQRSSLSAGGCITVKYIENGQLEAGECIFVGEAIMHSRVVAGKTVAVDGRKGLIVGGFVRAGEEVLAKVVGSPFATPTEIEVGVDPKLKDEFNQISEDCRKITEHLVKSEKAITLLSQMQERMGTLPSDKLILLSQLRLSVKAKQNELDAISGRRDELETIISQAQDGRVRIKDTIHPGTRVVIGPSSYRVRDTMAGATFKRQGVDVVVLPYA